MSNPSGLTTGIDNNGQLTNAYILATWPSNPDSDNVVSYELRIRKSAGDATGTAGALDALSMTDSTQTWAPGQWKGAVVIVGGSQALVADNTATVLSLVDPGSGQAWSPSQPVAGAYTISHIATYRTGGTSFRFPGLYQGTSYGVSIQAINNLGAASGWSGERTLTTASDSVAPDPPSGFTAIRTSGGAVLNWAGVDLTQPKNQDLRGYELQVWVGALQQGKSGLGQLLLGTLGDSVFLPQWASITPGGFLGTSFSYDAPRGTAPNTAINFRIRSIDWSGNASAWVTPGPVQAEGTYIDHLVAGTMRVFGLLSATGGFTTRPNLQGAGFDVLGTSFLATDGGAVDHGYGVGVTFKVDAATGKVYLAGDLRATGIISAAAFIGDATVTAPSFVTPSTGFTIDPNGGFNWYKAGVLQATWASNGGLTIYSGAAIYASTIASGQTVGATGGPLGFKSTSSGLGFYANGAPNQNTQSSLLFFLRPDNPSGTYSQQASVGIQDTYGSGGSGSTADLYVLASGRVYISGYATGGAKNGGSPQIVLDSLNGLIQLQGPTVGTPLDGGVSIYVQQSSVVFMPTGRSNVLTVGMFAGLNPSHTLHLGTDDAAKTTTTTWTTTSDSRLKRNVSDFTLGLDAIRRVRPVEFEWDADHPHAPRHEGRHVGVLAQEIAEVVPHSIRKHLHIDDEGEKHDYLGFTTHELIFVLVNAVKELAAKLDDVERRLSPC